MSVYVAMHTLLDESVKLALRAYQLVLIRTQSRGICATAQGCTRREPSLLLLRETRAYKAVNSKGYELHACTGPWYSYSKAVQSTEYSSTGKSSTDRAHLTIAAAFILQILQGLLLRTYFFKTYPCGIDIQSVVVDSGLTNNLFEIQRKIECFPRTGDKCLASGVLMSRLAVCM